ncbi:hypothetical protein [Peterkaempfera bronchialis]|uniref:hypothetical protein n=1 Tax=Peterkaempfera bronchialis TaxID=2126346 RepID=UPI003C2B27AD
MGVQPSGGSPVPPFDSLIEEGHMPPDRWLTKRAKALTSRRADRNTFNMPYSGSSQTELAVDCAVTGAGAFLAVLVLPVLLIREAAGTAALPVAAVAAAAAAYRVHVVYRRIRTG